jgi:phosphonate transport system substrate-binding protein
MSDASILLGAVAYDPKVLAFWEGMREYFRAQGVPLEFALFSSYERQVESLLGGHIDVAYNSPLAHVRVKRRADGRILVLGMRDVDRDFQTKILVRRDAGIQSLTDLHDRTLAVGSRDSVQARILPLFFLKRAGVDITRLKLLPFESDLGKHGDTLQSELEALAAVQDGRAQAGAVSSLVWQAEQGATRIDLHKVETLWTAPAYDHHVLDALSTGSSGTPNDGVASGFMPRALVGPLNEDAASGPMPRASVGRSGDVAASGPGPRAPAGPRFRPLASGSGAAAESWAQAFQRVLLDMRWSNPKHRKLLELEGARQWVLGREEGYMHLEAALEDQRGW